MIKCTWIYTDSPQIITFFLNICKIHRCYFRVYCFLLPSDWSSGHGWCVGGISIYLAQCRRSHFGMHLLHCEPVLCRIFIVSTKICSTWNIEFSRWSIYYIILSSINNNNCAHYSLWQQMVRSAILNTSLIIIKDVWVSYLQLCYMYRLESDIDNKFNPDHVLSDHLQPRCSQQMLYYTQEWLKWWTNNIFTHVSNKDPKWVNCFWQYMQTFALYIPLKCS